MLFILLINIIFLFSSLISSSINVLSKNIFIRIMDLYTSNFCEKSFNEIFACRWRKLVCCTADCRDIDYRNTRRYDTKIPGTPQFILSWYLHRNINIPKRFELVDGMFSKMRNFFFDTRQIFIFGILSCRELKKENIKRVNVFK